MNEINLWTAIAEMRRLTARSIPFSLEHYSKLWFDVISQKDGEINAQLSIKKLQFKK